MLKVLFDTSRLNPGNLHRGVGIYARLLRKYLSKIDDLEVLESAAKKNDYDLIHYPYFDFFSSSLPLLQAKPVVVTVHDAIPLKFSKYYPRGIKGNLRLIKQKSALKTVDAVVTDSFASKADIVTFLGVKENKIKVVPLAGNPEVTKKTRKEVNLVVKKHDLPKNFILYVGDINYNKNLPQLIGALPKIDTDYFLVCLGKNFRPQPIPEWEAIEKTIEKNQLASRVKFVTEISDSAELAAVYSAAKVYVQPSLAEGFGLPVLEAMQAQTPVVCSERSSLIEVGGNQVVFARPVADDFARAVNEVLAWTSHHKKKRINDALVWANSFSWEKTALATKKVYQSIL